MTPARWAELHPYASDMEKGERQLAAITKQLYLLGYRDLAHELMRDQVICEDLPSLSHILRKADDYLVSAVSKQRKGESICDA